MRALRSFVASLTETWTAPASALAGVGAPFLFPFARRGVASSVGVRVTPAVAQFRRIAWAAAGILFSTPAFAADGRHGAAHLALVAGTAVVIVLFVILPLFLRGRT